MSDPDFAALNRAAAAEMALRQQEAGRRWEPADGTPRANGMVWCVSHGGWVWGCNHHPERVEPAGPGESTTDVARWSALLDAAPIYPGLARPRPNARRYTLWSERYHRAFRFYNRLTCGLLIVVPVFVTVISLRPIAETAAILIGMSQAINGAFWLTVHTKARGRRFRSFG